MGVWWTVLWGGSPPPASVLAATSSSSGAIHYLMNVPGKGGEDLLLVSSDTCVLLDGQELAPRWTFSAPQVLRYWLFPRSLCSCCKPGPASPSPWQPRGGGREDQCASARGGLPVRGTSLHGGLGKPLCFLSWACLAREKRWRTCPQVSPHRDPS